VSFIAVLGSLTALQHVVSGISKERSWLRTAGCRTITRTETVYTFLVSTSQVLRRRLLTRVYQGFSRGAYQVRALAGMIHKVKLRQSAETYLTS
jgi:hypothetical protein